MQITPIVYQASYLVASNSGSVLWAIIGEPKILLMDEFFSL